MHHCDRVLLLLLHDLYSANFEDRVGGASTCTANGVRTIGTEFMAVLGANEKNISGCLAYTHNLLVFTLTIVVLVVALLLRPL